MVRCLYDCRDVPVRSEGVVCRMVVATHPAGKKKSPVGVTRAGIVYELFFTNLPQQAFTASDVVELYLHRGAFEPTLSDEDNEQDPDRWCSHSSWGKARLAGRVPMGMEYPARTGPSTGTDTSAHHRVCSCHPTAEQADCHTSNLVSSCLWIRSTYHCHVLENGALHQSRLSSSARWHAPLSIWPKTARA